MNIVYCWNKTEVFFAFFGYIQLFCYLSLIHYLEHSSFSHWKTWFCLWNIHRINHTGLNLHLRQLDVDIKIDVHGIFMNRCWTLHSFFFTSHEIVLLNGKK